MSIMSTRLLNLCTVCNEATTRRCNRCKSAQYCSPKCQKKDWPVHKLLCATFSTFDIATRPSREHLKTILFPEDGTQPEVVWVHAPIFGGGDGWLAEEVRQSPDIEPFLRFVTTDSPHTSWTKTVQYNHVLQRKLRHTLRIGYRETFLMDGSKKNKSVAKICATQPGLRCHDWRGPMVVYAMSGPGCDPMMCKDIDMNDFQHATDFSLSYAAVPTQIQPTISPSPVVDPVLGVRINCEGDQQIFQRPAFQRVEIPDSDPIYEEHDTSDIAKRVDLAIFTRSIAPDPRWANGSDNEMFTKDPYQNVPAAYLHICLDPEAGVEPNGNLGWGMPSLRWQDSVGSVLVVRQDRKPLSAFDIEALCKYCQHEVYPLFEHNTGKFAEAHPLSTEDLLTMICKPAFAIKWRNWQDERPRGSVDADAPSPWDI